MKNQINLLPTTTQLLIKCTDTSDEVKTQLQPYLDKGYILKATDINMDDDIYNIYFLELNRTKIEFQQMISNIPQTQIRVPILADATCKEKLEILQPYLDKGYKEIGVDVDSYDDIYDIHFLELKRHEINFLVPISETTDKRNALVNEFSNNGFSVRIIDIDWDYEYFKATINFD